MLSATFALLSASSALAVTLSGNFTPSYDALPGPSVRLVRPASEGLSPNETAWLTKRRPNVISALETYLTRVAISGFDVNAYTAALRQNVNNTPNIGMTFSGGGERAFLCGLGIWQAFDDRHAPAVDAKTGGLTQVRVGTLFAWASAHPPTGLDLRLGHTGLSGGSETTLALAMSDFADTQTLLNNGNLFSSVNVNETLFGEIVSKEEAGFNASNFLNNGSDTDPFSRKFSDVTSFSRFANGDTPFPTIMLNEVIPAGVSGSLSSGGVLYPAFNSSNATNYEVTPYEWGSWTGRAQAFAALPYLGTPLDDGRPAANFSVEGYDTAAFIGGTALSASNLWILQNRSNGTAGQFDRRSLLGSRREAYRLQRRQGGSEQYGPTYPPNEATIEQERAADGTAGFVDAIPDILSAGLFGNASAEQLTYAVWPNAFAGYAASADSLQGQDYVLLQDGSETGQINPIWPLIQTERRPDFLVVSDNSGTELSSGWMNGTNFQVTSARARAANIPFPAVPDSNTFVNFNYTIRPTFFGCNEPEVPLVLFIANAPYTAYTNATPILNVGLSSVQLNAIFDNGLAQAAQTNGTDENWPACIACGSIYRSLQRLKIAIPDVCRSCMRDHCWQGNYTTQLPRFVAPALLNNPGLSFASWNETVWTPAASQGNNGSSSVGTPNTGANAAVRSGGVARYPSPFVVVFVLLTGVVVLL